MKRADYCSYKLSMFGRQAVKQHIMYERKTLIRKMWTFMIFFILFGAAAVFSILETALQITGYSDLIAEFSILFMVLSCICLIIFLMLLHHGFRYCLGRNSDLTFIKKGGYKVDTFYVAGSYRARKTGLGSAGIRSLLEGSRKYVNGTIRGNTIHAVDLTGEMVEGSYRPCISLDNGSVFVLPRTAVIAPRDAH